MRRLSILLLSTASVAVSRRQVLAFALIPQRQSWSRQAQSDFTMHQLRRRHRDAGAPRSFLSSPLHDSRKEKNEHAIDRDKVSNEARQSSRREKSEQVNDRDKVAEEALQSIKLCFRSCFAASFADLLVSIIDDNLWSKWWGASSLASGAITWMDWIDLVDSLNVFIFGLGLRRISTLYFTSLQDRERRMSEESVLDLMSTMAKLWKTCALSLGLVSISMASSLYQQSDTGFGPGLPSFVGIAIGSLAFANGIIRVNCRSNMKKALAKDEAPEVQNEGREMGYRAYRNQALCAGVFGIMTAIELAKWLANKAQAGIVARIFAIPDILTPATITTLLFTLNKRFLSAFIAATRTGKDGATAGNESDEEIYNQLFVAQKGFYSKVGATLKSAAIFRVLPYVVTPMKPYLAKIAQLIVPSTIFEKLGSAFRSS